MRLYRVILLEALLTILREHPTFKNLITYYDALEVCELVQKDHVLVTDVSAHLLRL